MMTKRILIGCLAFLLTSTFFGQSTLEKKLVNFKWVDREHAFIATGLTPDENEIENFEKVKRSITLVFAEDKTFYLDSLKQRYTGTWVASEKNVTLTFDKTNFSTILLEETNEAVGSISLNAKKVPIQLGTRTLAYDGENLTIHDYTYKPISSLVFGLYNLWDFTAFPNMSLSHIVMIIIGLIFIFLAIKYDYEPLLLIPIGFGILIGNIPFFQVLNFNLKLGVYQEGSVFNVLYQGVIDGWYPPLIFLGIGAMTDFSTLIANPKLLLLGAAAQIGIFLTFLGALVLGFAAPEAAAIGIIGGADGPTSIFLASKLANGITVYHGEVMQNLIGPIAIAAYSYMALVPVIQPPIVYLLTNKRERKMKMKPPRVVTRVEKIIFPIICFLICAMLIPSALPLLGMLFFGNLLKESGVTERLAETARKPLIDTITILLGVTVGASTQADVFLQWSSLKIFGLGALSFIVATAGGLLGAKLMNLIVSNKVNPMIGAAGVSAVPDSARVVQSLGLKEDPNNHLLMHAMAPNVAGVIGSAVSAGILLGYLL